MVVMDIRPTIRPSALERSPSVPEPLPTPPASAGPRRLAWLDALRGIAALVVVFEHASYSFMPELPAGVDAAVQHRPVRHPGVLPGQRLHHPRVAGAPGLRPDVLDRAGVPHVPAVGDRRRRRPGRQPAGPRGHARLRWPERGHGGRRPCHHASGVAGDAQSPARPVDALVRDGLLSAGRRALHGPAAPAVGGGRRHPGRAGRRERGGRGHAARLRPVRPGRHRPADRTRLGRPGGRDLLCELRVARTSRVRRGAGRGAGARPGPVQRHGPAVGGPGDPRRDVPRHRRPPGRERSEHLVVGGLHSRGGGRLCRGGAYWTATRRPLHPARLDRGVPAGRAHLRRAGVAPPADTARADPAGHDQLLGLSGAPGAAGGERRHDRPVAARQSRTRSWRSSPCSCRCAR
jgi:hypothetical protein